MTFVLAMRTMAPKEDGWFQAVRSPVPQTFTADDAFDIGDVGIVVDGHAHRPQTEAERRGARLLAWGCC